MGQEAEAEARKRVFAPFRVDGRLMGLARPDAIFHALPAGHRGDEVTSEVLDSPQSSCSIRPRTGSTLRRP